MKAGKHGVSAGAKALAYSEVIESRLDDALRGTFPASDPYCVDTCLHRRGHGAPAQRGDARPRRARRGNHPDVA